MKYLMKKVNYLGFDETLLLGSWSVYIEFSVVLALFYCLFEYSMIYPTSLPLHDTKFVDICMVRWMPLNSKWRLGQFW